MAEDLNKYIDGVIDCNRRMLAKTITLMESSVDAHQAMSREILEKLLPRSGNAVRLGITGVPGVGKSTFIESFGLHLAKSGKKVAVLAVDPSSTRSGGSVMADKTRMEKLAVHPNAYIRPSPSGGTLGGVARKTRETMLVCEAAGFDAIIVETVGVGQSETEVASMVDFFLVLMLAGAGDELQGIKKGVLEIADAIAINKADGDNVEKANQARKSYEFALNLLAPENKLWTPPVVTCSARELTGIPEIWETILDHREKFVAHGELDLKRKRQALAWMWSLVEEGLKEHFRKNEEIKKRLPKISGDVERGITTPTIAAKELLSCLNIKV
jgi:LAO/AO transport system kinase